MNRRIFSLITVILVFFAAFGSLSSGGVCLAGTAVLEGELENPVVFLELDGCADYFTESKRSDTLETFNASEEGSGGLKNYFSLMSGGKLQIGSEEALSVDLDKLRDEGICPFEQPITPDYFRQQTVSNPNGFPEEMKSERERLLVEWVLKALDRSGWRGGSDINGDGVLDMLTIYVSTDGAVGSEDILWPHMTSWSSDLGKLGDLSVRNYIIVSDGVLGNQSMPVSVVCHETVHLLNTLGPEGKEFGVADLYPESQVQNYPVGVWDIMGSTTQDLQNFNAVYREKFGWIRIPTLSQSGQVQLDEGQAVRFGERSGEYFVIEHRSTRGLLDVGLLDNPFLGESALVLYRVREDAVGNLTEPYEIVFFENTSENAIIGNPNIGKNPQAFNALFYPDNHSDFSSFFYSDGRDAGMRLTGIRRAENSSSLIFDLDVNERLITAQGRLICGEKVVAGASVLVNGTAVGTTDEQGSFYLEGIRRGDEITFAKRGYRFVGSVKVSYGEEPHVDLDLTGIQVTELMARNYCVTVSDREGTAVADARFTLNGEAFPYEYADGTLTFVGFEGDVLNGISPTHIFEGPVILTEQTTFSLFGDPLVSITLTFTENGKRLSRDITVFLGDREVVAKDGSIVIEDVVLGQVLTFTSSTYCFEPLEITHAGAYTVEGRLKEGIIRVPAIFLYLLGGVLVAAVVIVLVRDRRKKARS